MTETSFLDLPAEIRSMIYSHLVPELEEFTLEARPCPAWRDFNWSRFAELICFRLVCSQINKEVLNHFFSRNSFNIEIFAFLKPEDCKIYPCVPSRIDILQYPSLRNFRMPFFNIFTSLHMDDDLQRGFPTYFWRVRRNEVEEDFYPLLDDIEPGFHKEYVSAISVKGQSLLGDLFHKFVAETDGPFKGVQARHLEQIIDSMNKLLECELVAAYVAGYAQYGLRRSARSASLKVRDDKENLL